MKLTKLIAKNFRSLHDVELNGLDQFNVLIGKNNSGKSAFFGAIRFLSDIINARPANNWGGNIITNFSPDLSLEIHLEMQPSSEELRSVATNIAPKNREEAWLQSAFGRDLHFEFRSIPGQPEILFPYRTEVRTVKGNMAVLQEYVQASDNKFVSQFDGTPNLLDEGYTSADDEHEPPLIVRSVSRSNYGYPIAWAKDTKLDRHMWPFYLLGKYLNSAFFFDHVRKFYFEQSVGSDGRLQQDGANLVQVLNYWSNNNRPKFDKIEEFVQKAFATVGGLETPFSKQNQQNILTAFRSGASGGQIPLQHMGGGVAQMLMAAVIIETTASDHPIFIEEPETNLHPGAQRFLAEQFCEQDRQVFITTHSPIFINLQRPKSVHKISMNNGKTTAVSLDDETLHVALGEIGARNSDVLMSDAVIFVEGESDLRVIQEWCRIAGIELAGTNTNILPMHSLSHPLVGVPIRSNTLKDIAANAKIPHLFILDADELSEAVINRLKKDIQTQLHIFGKREIENYLLKVRPLKLAIEDKFRESGTAIDHFDRIEEKEIERSLRRAADKQRNRVLIKRIRGHLEPPEGGFFPRRLFEEMEGCATWESLAKQISTRLGKYYDQHLSKLQIQKVVKNTRSKFERDWKHQTKRLDIAAGSELLEAVFDNFGLKYKKTTDAVRIARRMTKEDFDPEVHQLLERIRCLTAGAGELP
jgi:predicted ATP-dependent endonuclease of OLD family